MWLHSLITVSESIAQALLQHGSIALFALLTIGIVGMPIPDETLLVTAGFLLAKSKLLLLPTLIAAYAGSMCGISISYAIGCTAGSYLVKKYGHWLGITDKRIARTRHWFNHIGGCVLTFGYFVPGIRHITGYVAGTIEMRLPRFMLFAYSGALVWSTLFLTIGYYLGH